MDKKLLIFLTVCCLMLLISMNALADTINLETNLGEEPQFSRIMTDTNDNNYSMEPKITNSDIDKFGHGPGRGRGPGPKPHPNRGPGPGPDGAFLLMTMTLFFAVLILHNP